MQFLIDMKSIFLENSDAFLRGTLYRSYIACRNGCRTRYWNGCWCYKNDSGIKK